MCVVDKESLNQEIVYQEIPARCLRSTVVYCLSTTVLRFDKWGYGDQHKQWPNFNWVTINFDAWVTTNAVLMDILCDFTCGQYFGYLPLWLEVSCWTPGKGLTLSLNI